MTVLFSFIERSMKMTRRLPVLKVYERSIFSAKKGKESDLGAEPPHIHFFCAPAGVPVQPRVKSKMAAAW